MSKNQQIEKNFKLTSKLAEYLSVHPEMTKDVPSGSSYVVFSITDKKLNSLNSRLMDNLVKKGQQVVKAVEKSGNKWNLQYISP